MYLFHAISHDPTTHIQAEDLKEEQSPIMTLACIDSSIDLSNRTPKLNLNSFHENFFDALKDYALVKRFKPIKMASSSSLNSEASQLPTFDRVRSLCSEKREKKNISNSILKNQSFANNGHVEFFRFQLFSHMFQ